MPAPTSLNNRSRSRRRHPGKNATHVLIQAGDHGGPIEFARLGVLQALFPEETPIYHSVRKDWRNHTKRARDE
jgi:hypothetical protein